MPKFSPNTKIRIVKKVPVENPIVEQVPVEQRVEVVEEKLDDRVKKAQMKREQTEKELKKNAELVSKGIDPESLLTKDNFKKWIEVENLTYAQIARDHIGIPASQIATVAKGFGVQSPILKKRAAILARKFH